jgi:hypothetical protein
MSLMSKIKDPDPDFRFMALNDLLTLFTTSKIDFLSHDFNMSRRTADHVVEALDDQNGEVQNQAIKWYEDGLLISFTLSLDEMEHANGH